jgi:hypothetical protein
MPSSCGGICEPPVPVEAAGDSRLFSADATDGSTRSSIALTAIDVALGEGSTVARELGVANALSA